MDVELLCPACSQLFSNPILLPCGHALCLHCALQLQQQLPCPKPAAAAAAGGDCVRVNGQVKGQAGGHRQQSEQQAEESDTSTGSDVTDKLSLISESDSGVMCGSGSVIQPPLAYLTAASGASTSSWPPSYTPATSTPATTSSSSSSGATSVNSRNSVDSTNSDWSLPIRPTSSSSSTAAAPAAAAAAGATTLACLRCGSVAQLGASGAYHLPRFRLLQRLVDRHIACRPHHPISLPPPPPLRQCDREIRDPAHYSGDSGKIDSQVKNTGLSAPRHEDIAPIDPYDHSIAMTTTILTPTTTTITITPTTSSAGSTLLRAHRSTDSLMNTSMSSDSFLNMTRANNSQSNNNGTAVDNARVFINVSTSINALQDTDSLHHQHQQQQQQQQQHQQQHHLNSDAGSFSSSVSHEQLHQLVRASGGGGGGVGAEGGGGGGDQSSCQQHSAQPLVNYCVPCCRPVCNVCVQENRHSCHQLLALSAVARKHKSELSGHLQCLAERVKKATNLIHHLKTQSDDVTSNCKTMTDSVEEQCAQLQERVEQRKEHLITYLHTVRDDKMRLIKQQVSDATSRLHQTNGLLMFCIEALKERDDTAFLQVAHHLNERISTCDQLWGHDLVSQYTGRSDFDLLLDVQPLNRAIGSLHFIQTKSGHTGNEREPAAPEAPVLLEPACCVESNTIVLSWQPHLTSRNDGFVVQLDDGSGFKDANCVNDVTCRLTGLHFDTQYRCRVRSYNQSGESLPSAPVTFHTAKVAQFVFATDNLHRDVTVTCDGTLVTCSSFESRVVLGSAGVSRGRHYWRLLLVRYDGSADPAFGMARAGVCRAGMLGKDSRGWSMYIDDKRSWLMHHDLHSGRVEGGVRTGDTVAVLLDLDVQKMTFYVNDVIQGRIDFAGLTGTFYPAVSLNRNTAIKLETGLTPPPPECPDS